jgi:3-phosphoshikimate 1-carboxyvinyltransferase
MKPITIKPCKKLRGSMTMPGDKSISHRAAICAGLAKGRTTIKNFLFSDDCRVTLGALEQLGVRVVASEKKGKVVIESSGLFLKPGRSVWMGESGTSARVFMGLLAGQSFATSMSAAASLNRRPMARVIDPLRMMGAHIEPRKTREGLFLPARFFPSRLVGIRWEQDVASAQVKSALLLAGLFAGGTTKVIEPMATRDHTERMLKLFNGRVRVNKNMVSVEKCSLKPPLADIVIPGDISSAAFFIVAALLAKDARILIKNVGVNPTRMGLVRVLKRMGGRILINNIRKGYEPVADLEVASSRLRATVVGAGEIPALVDEVPILMVAAALAEGKTILEGTGELRVKETDRIHSMVSNLSKLGVTIKVRSLKKNVRLEIKGCASLSGGKALQSFSDHRTAMSMIVAGLMADAPVSIDDTACISKSFPGFMSVIKHLLV